MRTSHTSTCVCCQVFNPGSKVNPYTGGSMKEFTEVTGAVTTKGLITAVTDTLDSTHISQLQTSAQHDSFLQKDPELAKVLVFTDKANSTVLAKGLSWAYARRLLFAEVRPSDADGQALAQQYGVSTYPTILVLKVSRAHSHSSTLGGGGGTCVVTPVPNTAPRHLISMVAGACAACYSFHYVPAPFMQQPQGP